MKTKIENEAITIPVSIMALVDATSSEKMLLALYARDPHARNHQALKVLGVSLSGLKKIKNRLIDKGWWRMTANGHQVSVPGMDPVPADEEGHFVTKSEAIQNEHKVASIARVQSPVEILRDYESCYYEMSKGGNITTIYRLTENALRTLDSVLPEGPTKDAIIADLTVRRDAFQALSYVSLNAPAKEFKKWDQMIGTASPEKLALMCVHIQGAQLAGAKPVHLLAALNKDSKEV